jgi:hypothetical protein
LVASLVLASFSGCSFLFVTPPPPPGRRGGVINCTTNRAPPVLDTIFTATNVGSAIYVATQDNVTNKGTAVGLGLAVAGIWLASAIYGYSNTAECEELLYADDEPPTYRPRPRPMPARRPPPTTAPAPPAPSGEPPPPAPYEPPSGAAGAAPAPAPAPPSAPGSQRADEETP